MDAARRRRFDAHLDAAVAGLQTHDPRVRGLAVTARSDGGVVHLTGDVDGPAELALLRRLIGLLAGVHGVHPASPCRHPTHVRLLDTQTFKRICDLPDRSRWHALHISRDESTVFADLTPVGPEHNADPVHLARFFD